MKSKTLIALINILIAIPLYGGVGGGLLPSDGVGGGRVHVSPSGSDKNDGTQAKPFKTLRMALRHARNMHRLGEVTGSITIHVAEGNYQMWEPLYVRPEDHDIIIKGEGQVCLSGGVQVTGWKRQGKLLVAESPEYNGNVLDFRQLYVNGEKAVRARDVQNFDNMAHILSLDKPNEIMYVSATAAIKALARQGVGRAEMVLHEMWCVANLRIKDIKIAGDSAAVTFHQPESTIQFEHPWPCPMVNTKPFTREDGKVLNLNSAFYLTNHKALLDTPGEWYHDTKNHKLYYYPRTTQEASEIVNSSDCKCYVPALETLVEVAGTLDRKVQNVRFENISFDCTTWMRPSTDGHVPLQAGMYMYEGYKLRPQTVRPDRNHKLDNQGFLGRPAAAVSVMNADGIAFDNCTFRHLGSSGIDYVEGTHGGVISNCTFTDIAGNGIVAGSFSPSAFETHLPYDPQDHRVVCDGLVIANNNINNVANEDWGCLGICCGYVSNCIIAHNEVSEVSYSGINLGWGWTQSVNCMRGNEVYRNYIHHYARHMYDCAGIYTLGAQPKTYVLENVVEDIYHPVYAHDPNHWFYLYCDEGSSFITVQDNWTPTEKFLKNANGPCCVWENNGPDVNDSVKVNAGIKRGLDIGGLRTRIQTRKPKKQ